MSLAEEVELLRRIPMFANVEISKLKLLAFTSERVSFHAGDVLFQQNEMGSSAFIIVSGEADVTVDTPGAASVVARTDMTTLCISKDLFFRMVTEFPQMAVEIMRVLAQRLENTTRQLQEAVSGAKPG